MRPLILIALSTAMSLPALTSAQAQDREYSGQVQNVRLYNTPKTSQTEDTALGKAEHTKDPKDMNAADRVWEKYKELAMGQAQEEPDKKTTSEKDSKTADKTASAETTKAEAPTANNMNSMIEAYQKNKEQRAQMQTRSFAQPKANEKTDEKTAE